MNFFSSCKASAWIYVLVCKLMKQITVTIWGACS